MFGQWRPLGGVGEQEEREEGELMEGEAGGVEVEGEEESRICKGGRR